MNRSELIAAVAEKAGVTKARAGEAVEATLQAIQETLATGEEVRITGFGSFTVSQRAAGEARNPRTGESVQVPASKVPRFKPGTALKEAINK